jgi:predicted ArsR family transcriptional regulator
MSKTPKRGRPARQYRIRVRSVRRDPIDYAKLAQAALEQAAMNQRRDDDLDRRNARQEPDDQQHDTSTEGDRP